MPRNKEDDILIGGFGQPAQNVDATGRMIRNSTPPVPTRKPETGIKPPAYRKGVFSGRRQQEWDDWTRNTEFDPNLSSVQKKAFQDIYAAEGGMKKDQSSSAVGGILQPTIKILKDKGFIDSVIKKHGPNVKTTDLDQEDIKSIYKAYFDDVLDSAAKGHNIINPINPVRGSQILDLIGDKNTASAVADTLFRDGSGNGTTYTQKAINMAEGKTKVKVEDAEDSTFGSETFQALQEVAKDSQKRQKFLDALADQRKKAEKARNDHFRFRQ
jgi:hypothetical protein